MSGFYKVLLFIIEKERTGILRWSSHIDPEAIDLEILMKRIEELKETYK